MLDRYPEFEEIFNNFNFKDLILLNAERKCYGLKPKALIINEDDNIECLYLWEITNTTLLPLRL